MRTSSGTAIPGLSALCPSTSTSPAITRACALARLSARPRSTINRSSRRFIGLGSALLNLFYCSYRLTAIQHATDCLHDTLSLIVVFPQLPAFCLRAALVSKYEAVAGLQVRNPGVTEYAHCTRPEDYQNNQLAWEIGRRECQEVCTGGKYR